MNCTPNHQTLAIITVLYRCEQHLPEFFRCLSEQTDKNLLLVIIDNASPDRSGVLANDLSAQFQIKCHFIRNRENTGFSVANNQGITWAKEQGFQHFILANNDTLFERNFLAKVRQSVIQNSARVWVCLAHLKDKQGIWYAGGHLDFWRARGVHWTSASPELGRGPVPVDFAPACMMYVHGSVWDEVGLLDPDYFVYYEDTDFCWRLKKANIPICYDPGAEFVHLVGASSGGDLSPFFLRISTRNKFMYIRKNYPQPWTTMVFLLTVLTKLAQLVISARRDPTWQGLQDSWAGRRGNDLP